MRILLIDDDDEFRTELQLWLTGTLKHSVAVATSIEEAKKQLQQDRYHAILLDGRLRKRADERMDPSPTAGRVGGLEVLDIMSPTQRSKTIWVTAHHMDDLSDPALLGCNCFLFKRWITPHTCTNPYSDKFHQKLQAHLDRLAAERPTMWTTFMGWLAIFLVIIGITWQLFEQFTPAFFAYLLGAIVNLYTFRSILIGLPVHRLLRLHNR